MLNNRGLVSLRGRKVQGLLPPVPVRRRGLQILPLRGLQILPLLGLPTLRAKNVGSVAPHGYHSPLPLSEGVWDLAKWDLDLLLRLCHLHIREARTKRGGGRAAPRHALPDIDTEMLPRHPDLPAGQDPEHLLQDPEQGRANSRLCLALYTALGTTPHLTVYHPPSPMLQLHPTATRGNLSHVTHARTMPELPQRELSCHPMSE